MHHWKDTPRLSYMLALVVAIIMAMMNQLGAFDDFGGGDTFEGGTVTSAITFDGVASPDITSGTNEDIGITPNGTGDVTFDTDLLEVCDGACPSWLSSPAFGVEGIAEFRSATYFYGAIRLNEDILFQIGGNQGTFFVADNSYDEFKLSIDNNQGGNLIIYNNDVNSFVKRFDHSHDGYAGVYWQGPVDPDTDNTIWGRVFQTGSVNDGGSFTLSTGSGIIELAPSAPGVLLPHDVSATPAEATVCRVETEGMIQYARDTDAGAGAVCVCAHTGSAYDWRDLSDVAGTACSFF